MTINCSLGGFAAHMLAAGADMKLAEEAVLEKACVMVEKEAKDVIGTYRYDWPQRRSNGRASGTRPMSRCCAMERCGPRSRTLSFHMSMLAMLAQPVKSQPIRNWEPGGSASLVSCCRCDA